MKLKMQSEGCWYNQSLGKNNVSKDYTWIPLFYFLTAFLQEVILLHTKNPMGSCIITDYEDLEDQEEMQGEDFLSNH